VSWVRVGLRPSKVESCKQRQKIKIKTSAQLATVQIANATVKIRTNETEAGYFIL
jgi:hypothetical protein